MKRTFAILLTLCMLLAVLGACAKKPAETEPAPAPESAAPAPVEEQPAEDAAPVEEEPVEEQPVEEAIVPEEELAPVEEEPVEEEPVPEEPVICTITFSDGQTFEATAGEDFVFFFQCDAPGDMGQPAEGEEGAGITVSEGTVTYSNVGLGGPFKYPTSEKVTLSGFTGDITVTITEAASNMGATYTIYTDEEEIANAIAFAEEMAAQQASNPMPQQEGGGS